MELAENVMAIGGIVAKGKSTDQEGWEAAKPMSYFGAWVSIPDVSPTYLLEPLAGLFRTHPWCAS